MGGKLDPAGSLQCLFHQRGELSFAYLERHGLNPPAISYLVAITLSLMLQ